MAVDQTAMEREAPYPLARTAWFVVATLFVVTLFSQLDRQLPALLVKPIKAEFAISDTSFSMLQGYAFAFIYTIMGLPFGRLVDRMNRRNLIIGGVLLWSLMTVLSGFATTYTQFFVTRMGIGVGEAVLAPAAYSIIADYFSPAVRGRAVSVYYLSLAIGQGASMVVGGLILSMVPPEGLAIPLLGHFEPWRMGFLLAGAPGALLALLLLLIREPARRENTDSGVAAARGSLQELFGYIRAHRGAFMPVFLCPLTLAIIGYAAVGWAAAFYDRHYGIDASKSGVMMGALLAGGGVIGTIISGFLGDYFSARGTPSARLKVMLVSWAFVLPSAVLWTTVPSLTLSFVFFGLMAVGSIIGHSSVPAMVQEIVPNRMRGQVVAAYLLLAGLGGIALAPTATALITDHVFRDDRAVGWSLAIVAGPVGLLGLLVTVLGLKPYAWTQKVIRDNAAAAG